MRYILYSAVFSSCIHWGEASLVIVVQLHTIWGLNQHLFLLLTSPRVFGIWCSTFQKSTGPHSSPVPAGGNVATLFRVSRLKAAVLTVLPKSVCPASWFFSCIRPCSFFPPWELMFPVIVAGCQALRLKHVTGWWWLSTPVLGITDHACVWLLPKKPTVYFMGCLRNSEAPLTFSTAWFG